MSATGWTIYFSDGGKRDKKEVENNRPKAEREAGELIKQGCTIRDLRWFGKVIPSKTAIDFLNAAYKHASKPN